MLRVRHLSSFVKPSSVCCRDMYALVSAHTVQCDLEFIIKTTTLSIKRYYTHAAEAHFHAIYACIQNYKLTWQSDVEL